MRNPRMQKLRKADIHVFSPEQPNIVYIKYFTQKIIFMQMFDKHVVFYMQKSSAINNYRRRVRFFIGNLRSEQIGN